MKIDPLIAEARAVAQGLKDTAAHCDPHQEALKARLVIAAHMIVRLCHRIEQPIHTTENDRENTKA